MLKSTFGTEEASAAGIGDRSNVAPMKKAEGSEGSIKQTNEGGPITVPLALRTMAKACIRISPFRPRLYSCVSS